MENKINVAELLRNCPEGMELDCNLFNKPLKYLGLEGSDDEYSIRTVAENGEIFWFTKEGYVYDNMYSKCVIFPKGKTSWKDFKRPFVDGDIVATNSGSWIGIMEKQIAYSIMTTYCVLIGDGGFEAYIEEKGKWCFDRLATEEEKQRLFDAIEKNGYKWDAEKKCLEKLIEPKFKVGDKVRVKNGVSKYRIIDGVFDTFYSLQMFGRIDFTEQDRWELVPNKFDINTLKHFDKVLVRNYNTDEWDIDFFGYYSRGFYHTTGRSMYRQCIPYKGNEYIVGKSVDCAEYYKTWED